MELYIGLMSGTSADGIDAALVDFSGARPVMVETLYTPYPSSLRKKILGLCHEGDDEINRMGELDSLLGKEFAEAANQLLKQVELPAMAVKGIGSHGQTIRHYPEKPYRFTLQIGDPNTIAALTGITTVADFRRKDIALGGQGAPLVPAFHQYMFSSEKMDRAIVNIGGIANVSLLQKNAQALIGFDTGPGNVLLDAWVNKIKNESHDRDGEWAAKGVRLPELLRSMLADNYFQLPAPKSTGREYFNLAWLEKHIRALRHEASAIDVQATLVDLTAQSILDAIQKYTQQAEILICGGGASNHFLMKRLSELATHPFSVASTENYGVHPDWVEAMAFAWLARQTLNRKPGNVPSVTGAKQAVILGGIYYGK